ncbi:DUF3310 domain-containing protein [Achromobacter pestifer]|uniref:DUF3310 domain-containing protein n=1 Tax=Achromobacter pestifer TaxID=1353889 RepID=A0A6S6Z150_9BURK|nr:DUF3310 domain-containing protein [Achromobacter pestifer]CAB3624453.1 hypothetical protein LMG3431_00019 [Achromobacter pestifer]
MREPASFAPFVEDNSPAQHALHKLLASQPLQPPEVHGLRKCLTEILAKQPELTEARADLKALDAAYPNADVVNHPAHYTAGGVECIDAIAAATTGLEGIEAACTANAIKYLWRWKRKNGPEDLRKARWYINHLLGEN